jgi:hypothetical protein
MAARQTIGALADNEAERFRPLFDKSTRSNAFRRIGEIDQHEILLRCKSADQFIVFRFDNRLSFALILDQGEIAGAIANRGIYCAELGLGTQR